MTTPPGGPGAEPAPSSPPPSSGPAPSPAPHPREPAITGRAASGRFARLGYRALGLVFLALAIAGIVLPGLPATPFLLLCVWAFGRGAPAWAARVEAHPHLGPPLRNWRERGVVPKRAKVLAIASMAASLALLWHRGVGVPLLAAIGAVLLGVAAFLLSRPSR